MNKETLALIEAAEAIMQVGLLSDEWEKTGKRLEDAISSAKAAEEGVETTYDVETQIWNWVRDTSYTSPEDARKRSADLAGRWNTRVARKDTYTTVIEVREKEGV